MTNGDESPVWARFDLAIVLAALLAAVTLVYRAAALSYFLNDDFQWLQGARQFEFANLFHLERYDHFYRPVIEIYFYLGRRLFGCAPLPFHLASIGIHLLNTLVLFFFARALTGRSDFGALAALLFAVQPGHVQAVAWVGAITDLLPALWYLLALLAYLLFLQGRGARYYALSLAAFVGCLLTHESSATLLPMMILLDLMWRSPSSGPARLRLSAQITRYAPFVCLLAAYLVVAYVVNSRSYLIKEGHYRFGWHAVPNVLRYVASLYVGPKIMASYVAIVFVTGALLVRGTMRVRFLTLWIFVTLLPASFFTWDNASRYLYLPAAGLALLLATAAIELQRLAERWLSPRIAHRLVTAVALAVAVRFALFAAIETANFRTQTRPYERYVAAVRDARRSTRPSDAVAVSPQDARDIPEMYLQPAAQMADCDADVKVTIR